MSGREYSPNTRRGNVDSFADEYKLKKISMIDDYRACVQTTENRGICLII